MGRWAPFATMANQDLQANWRLLGEFNRSDERSASSRVVYVLGRTQQPPTR